jgi:hypothetical protein
MEIAIVFGWFAQDSRLAAELSNDPLQREMWLRLASMWSVAAQRNDERSEDSAAFTSKATPRTKR